MRRSSRSLIFQRLVIILVFLGIQSTLALAQSSQLAGEIEKIIKAKKINPDSFGLIVQDLKTEKVLYDHQSQRLFIPASNVKLVTSAASLYILGPHYSFQTRALADGEIKGGILYGNLYLKGFGDPFLVSEELWRLAREVKALGIKQINGDIIGDESYFDAERIGPAWPKGDLLEPYKPQISGLSLNFNTIAFNLSPGSVVGNPVTVSVDPEGEYVRLHNEAKTSNGRSHDGLSIYREFRENTDRFLIKGSLPINSKTQKVYKNISEPALYTVNTFFDFLKKEGINIQGRSHLGIAPPSARDVAVHFSKPLSQVIADMNKYSNNFMAEQVLKTIGAETEGPPGTWEKGLRVVSGFLTQVGIPEGKYTLVDGSGLSRLNLFSPGQFLKVLSIMYRDFKLQPEYLASLAIIGIDGTMHKRLKGSPGEGKIRAKTGTLNGAKSLSGYAEAIDGRTLAFSFIVNFAGDSPADISGFINGLSKALIE